VWERVDKRWLPVWTYSLPARCILTAPVELVEWSDRGVFLHFVILGVAYWMFSRRAVVGHEQFDVHELEPVETSPAFRHGYLERPIVDEWFEVLRKLMRATWPRLHLKRKEYSIRLSHDVDTPARYALISPTQLAGFMLLDLLKNRDRDRKAIARAPW